MNMEPIRDASGREIAPPQFVIDDRPQGPWDRNVPVVICAWHDGFNPRDPINANASHGMCEACAAKFAESA